MTNMWRLGNARNECQGPFKRVLFVCSAGMMRSATAAWVLSQDPWLYNTRACGVDTGCALILLDDMLIEWADSIICMSQSHKRELQRMSDKHDNASVWDIPDIYCYRDPKLVKIIQKKAKEEFGAT